VIALLLGDIGHLAVTFYILEYERFIDVSKWNALAWGNIAATVGSCPATRQGVTNNSDIVVPAHLSNSIFDWPIRARSEACPFICK
jgi:hypothetical protein